MPLTAQERRHADEAAEVLERIRKALNRETPRSSPPKWLMYAAGVFAMAGVGGVCAWSLFRAKSPADFAFVYFIAPFTMLISLVRYRIVDRLRPELDELHELRFAAPFSEIESEMILLLSVYPASSIGTFLFTMFVVVLLGGGVLLTTMLGCLPQLVVTYLLGFVLLMVAKRIELARLRKLHDWVAGIRCKCGYDLAGNASGRCPECGVAIPIAAVRELRGDITD